MTTFAHPPIHRFTRAEYDQMAAMGLFVDKRVELIKGEILDMPPQPSPHAYAIMILNGFIARQLGEDYLVRCQLPLAVSDDDEPEPDFAVVKGKAEEFKEHPATALWVAEIAYDPLARDREKIAIYAAAGVQEYWIINLRSREIIQHTHPRGAEYTSIRVLAASETITCAALPLPARLVEQYLPPF